ncbi:MAG: rod shape-determining protein RodA [Rikenellaceae bacterium]|nr:rod shape-determining protein RodA [Rikenellaceae bacterium]
MEYRQARKESLFGSVDRVALLLYLLLVAVGVVAVFSASWVEDSEDFFSFSHNYIKQFVWLGISFVVGVVIMLLDRSLWHKIAYFLYAAAILALLATLLFGRTVNGAKAWFEFGPIRLQTMEFAKIAIALATARLMSEFSFSISSFRSLVKVALLLLVPLVITYLQNDTGSGLVLCSFIFMLYREGLNRWLCVPLIFIAALFLLSFLFSPTVLLIALILVFTISASVANRVWRHGVIYLASLFGASTLLFLILNAIPMVSIDFYVVLISTALLSMIGVCIYAYRARLRNLYIMVLLFVVSVMITPTSNAVFNVLKPHQQNRIKTFLGITDDASLNYNVRQSKIAIGSGGFFGKGYLQGSHIRYGLVPEKHTDFIFCTIGEEFGFVGAFVVLALMMAFIMRLMRMGDNQRETFGRVYCYIVASILLFHTLINVGMTIGVVPVMGIPLPLISYGGSSLLAFSIMIFIAFAFDAQTTRELPTYSRL